MAKKKKDSAPVPQGASDIFDFDPFERFRMFRAMPVLKTGLFSNIPSIDLVDEGDKLRIRADLPGVLKEQIKLHVGSNSLSISAGARKEQERKGKNYYYKERASSGYYRSISLPSEVDPRSAKAKFENGTLEIVLSKRKNEKGSEVKIS